MTTTTATTMTVAPVVTTATSTGRCVPTVDVRTIPAWLVSSVNCTWFHMVSFSLTPLCCRLAVQLASCCLL